MQNNTDEPALPIEPGEAELDSAFLSYWNALDVKVPQSVFHYTDLEAFTSIVTKQELWATDAFHLNDYKEAQTGTEHFRAYLTAHAPKYDSAFVSALNAVIDRVDSVENRLHPFVASFCREGDLLSQWRGYTPHGSGIVLEFSTVALEKTINLQLLPVACTDSDYLHISKSYFAAYSMAWSKLNSQYTEHALAAAFETFSNKAFVGMSLAMPLFKSKSFHLEYENRLITHKSYFAADLQYRIRNNTLVPYVVLKPRPAEQLPLLSVRISPTYPNQDFAIKSLIGFLHARGYANVPVLKSNITYRK